MLSVEDRFIGLALAVSSSLLIGISFIITKKGLMDTSRRHGSAADSFEYLRNCTWWAGMLTMTFGEVANFAAYSFAPAILVTPLGALSVLISAILASYLLNEKLGAVGRSGCALCLLGSVVVVLHAPEERQVDSVDEILQYAVQPGFLFYCFAVCTFSIYMIYKVAPVYGRRSVLVYISICSLVGSVSVMAVKGFGIALKLTLSGSNQLGHPSTYLFAVVVLACVLTQMNYFNRALDTFSTNLVTPIYYVCFTTATIVASVVLFQGFNEADPVDTVSLLCGFVTIFIGVFLLNSQRQERRNSTLLGRLPNIASSLETGNSIRQGSGRRSSRRHRHQHRMVQSPKTRSALTSRSALDKSSDENDEADTYNPQSFTDDDGAGHVEPGGRLSSSDGYTDEDEEPMSPMLARRFGNSSYRAASSRPVSFVGTSTRTRELRFDRSDDGYDKDEKRAKNDLTSSSLMAHRPGHGTNQKQASKQQQKSRKATGRPRGRSAPPTRQASLPSPLTGDSELTDPQPEEIVDEADREFLERDPEEIDRRPTTAVVLTGSCPTAFGVRAPAHKPFP